MMTVLLVLLYLCIGAIVTFALCRLYVIVEPYNKYNGFEDGYIMVVFSGLLQHRLRLLCFLQNMVKS